jgi:hypothetical protein
VATNSRPCPTNWAVSSGSPHTDRRTPSAEWPAGFCRQVAVSAVSNPSPTLAKLGHIDLTSLSQAPREQADRAVEAVVERLDRGRTEPVSSVLMPQLVVRGTTATPAGP